MAAKPSAKDNTSKRDEAAVAKNLSIVPRELTLPAGLADRSVLRVEEAAAASGLPETALQSAIEEGRLLAVDVSWDSKRHWRIPVSALRAFLSNPTRKQSIRTA